jgi:hypothetical protein
MGRNKRLASKLCLCIKKVRKTVKVRKGSTKEGAAIGICVKSVLQTRGKTLKRFSCDKVPKLTTKKL